MPQQRRYLTPDQAEAAGRVVRKAWVEWARRQPMPKPSWLVSWEDLSEADKEADRHIADVLLRWWHEDS